MASPSPIQSQNETRARPLHNGYTEPRSVWQTLTWREGGRRSPILQISPKSFFVGGWRLLLEADLAATSIVEVIRSSEGVAPGVHEVRRATLEVDSLLPSLVGLRSRW
jgi:hypothetical protein